MKKHLRDALARGATLTPADETRSAEKAGSDFWEDDYEAETDRNRRDSTHLATRRTMTNGLEDQAG